MAVDAPRGATHEVPPQGKGRKMTTIADRPDEGGKRRQKETRKKKGLNIEKVVQEFSSHVAIQMVFRSSGRNKESTLLKESC